MNIKRGYYAKSKVNLSLDPAIIILSINISENITHDSIPTAVKTSIVTHQNKNKQKEEVYKCVYVLVFEREGEIKCVCVHMCVCVCMRARVCACVCACMLCACYLSCERGCEQMYLWF